ILLYANKRNANKHLNHNYMLCSTISSSICLLRGKIYDAMDNRPLATSSYKEALKLDVYCFEAFDLLTSHHMLTAQEERDFLDSLPLGQQCTEEEEELLHFLYENKLKKYNKPSEMVIPDMVNGLQDNLDVVVSLAERHYYNCDFKMCYALTSMVMVKDPFHANCLPVHIGTLVELSKANELFYLSHKLVDLYPNNPVSWFAVGCYYLMVGHKNEHARRYLSKATTLERTYGPAWIAYGHSFAVESDVQVTVDKWEPLLNNLGHVCRKLKKYEQALEYHRQALVLVPQHASTYSAIGYVHSLMGDFESAIDYFHTALGLKRDDTFSVTMLGNCIEMYIGDSDAYIGTDIKDKVKMIPSTTALKKILGTSADASDSQTQPLEESSVMALETPPADAFQRFLLECDMHENDMMLETSMSDTST
uniref:Cell division cycle 16 homolog (S. cerevisiae) n=1 Tax=Pygocentrus nattereri TaxID=42514 RepID=A0AAR2IYI4_PYGNA